MDLAVNLDTIPAKEAVYEVLDADFELPQFDEATDGIQSDEQVTAPLALDAHDLTAHEEDQRDAVSNAPSAQLDEVAKEHHFTGVQRAAVAAYAAISEEPIEDTPAAEPTGFAEILQSRWQIVGADAARSAASYPATPLSAFEDENDMDLDEEIDGPSGLSSFERIMRQVEAAAGSEIDFEAPAEGDGAADAGDPFVIRSSPESTFPQLPNINEAPEFVSTADFQRSPLFHTSIRVVPAPGIDHDQENFAVQKRAQSEDTAAGQFDMAFSAEGRGNSDLNWLAGANGLEQLPPLSPFAGSSNAYDETGEMDELDIPAFLRRPAES
jgi:hypothetical protein